MSLHTWLFLLVLCMGEVAMASGNREVALPEPSLEGEVPVAGARVAAVGSRVLARPAADLGGVAAPVGRAGDHGPNRPSDGPFRRCPVPARGSLARAWTDRAHQAGRAPSRREAALSSDASIQVFRPSSRRKEIEFGGHRDLVEVVSPESTVDSGAVA